MTFTPGRLLASIFLWLGWLLPGHTRAQVPAWALASVGGSVQANGNLTINATAVDAAGQVLVVGSFTSQVALGNLVGGGWHGGRLWYLRAGPGQWCVPGWLPK